MIEKFDAEKIAAIYAKVRAYWDIQPTRFKLNRWTELGDSVKVAFAYATGRIEGQRDIKEKAAQALVALRGDDCDGDVALAYAEEAIRAIPEGE